MKQQSSSFRIGQVSDIHITSGAVPDSLESVSSFEKVLNDVEKFDLDLLVLSGDLTEGSRKEEYEVFFRMISKYSGPWCLITGNHDRNSDLQENAPFSFPLVDGDYFYKKEVAGFPFFFLDSSSGKISRRQLDWLEEEAKRESGEVFLFVHHPPCLCRHRFMDSRYALENHEEARRAIQKVKNLKSIFVGHYHSDMAVDLGGGQTVYVAPATQMQLDPDSFEFKISSAVPGWRLIEYDDGKLSTEVRYL